MFFLFDSCEYFIIFFVDYIGINSVFEGIFCLFDGIFCYLEYCCCYVGCGCECCSCWSSKGKKVSSFFYDEVFLLLQL